MKTLDMTITVSCTKCGWSKTRHPKRIGTIKIHTALLNWLFDKHYLIHALEEAR